MHIVKNKSQTSQYSDISFSSHSNSNCPLNIHSCLFLPDFEPLDDMAAVVLDNTVDLVPAICVEVRIDMVHVGVPDGYCW